MQFEQMSDAELGNAITLLEKEDPSNLLREAVYERDVRKHRIPDAKFYSFWVGGNDIGLDFDKFPAVKIMLNTRDHMDEENAITHEHGGQTEEGYRNIDDLYYLEEMEDVGLTVIHERHECGADCDGKYEHHFVSFCPVSQLEEGVSMKDYCARGERYEYPEIPGMFWPVWQTKKAWNRDYEAEKAGY